VPVNPLLPLLTEPNPRSVLGRPIGHGLRYSPTSARSIRGDYLTVQNGGVFDLLYRKRTGALLPQGARLLISRLFGNCPEVETEIGELRFGSTCETRRRAVPDSVRVVKAIGSTRWGVYAGPPASWRRRSEALEPRRASPERTLVKSYLLAIRDQ